MADKGARNNNSGDQPVPMKLSTWEVVKSTPNCIPRLCSLTFTRLMVLKPLENELSSLLIAVKMQNSKRILRSNEIVIPASGLLDTGLDLSFSLQYPHFLKRDGNRLQVMLQRRKKYKNRTFLGFKTLAACQINMSQVLQCAIDRELSLYSDVKEQTKPVASLLLHGLSSQPVDQEINGHRKNTSSDVDRSPDVDDNSDEEDGPEYNDYSSNEDLSDSEPTMTEHEAVARARQRKISRSKARPAISQRNFKQKFRALLKKFKISEDVLTTLDSEADHDQIPNPQELDDLFDELEDSDSGPELDTMSVMSTPKPKLRPFFAGRGTTPEANEIPKTPSQEVFRSQEETPVRRSDSDLHTILNIVFRAYASQSISHAASNPKSLLFVPIATLTQLETPLVLQMLSLWGLTLLFFACSQKLEASDLNAFESITEGKNSSPLHRHSPNLWRSGTFQSPKYPWSGRPLDPHVELQSDPLCQSWPQSQSWSKSPWWSPSQTVSQLQMQGTPQSQPQSPSKAWYHSPIHRARQKKELVRGHVRSTSYREKKPGACQEELASPCRRPRRNSLGEDKGLQPRKALLEQLGQVFDLAEDHLPESLFLVSSSEWQGQMLAQKVQDRQLHVISTCSDADVKAAICFLVNKIQKFCNSNARTLVPIKLGVVGGDAYINSVLRPYVEHFSNKSPDWQNYTKFLVIPFGPSSVGKYIASIDSTYGSLFLDQQWKDTFEKPESPKLDSQDIVNRISKYVNGASSVHQMPIAEALIMCKGRSSDEVSSQIFIPFLSEVRIGTLDTFSSSVEYDDGFPVIGLSSSPPASTPVLERTKDVAHTPPNSPNMGVAAAAASAVSPPSSTISTGLPTMPSPAAEFMDLQVDYWVVSPPKSDNIDKDKDKDRDKKDKEKDKKESNKCSLKTAFRALYANRLPVSGGVQQTPTFSLMVVTKEKKQKIMRIGKKAKELESKSQAIEGVSRMVCTSKSQNVKLRVLVDGVEWTGVKFFQLSSQWQTHVKNFPVALFGSHDCL
ncbi:phosphofurin acidic cluster sorting protein 2 [Plakobranchus ocellatus]|uniref:Phosphofurin acidic cluster sorting protein 2 n=1 Tax=Plakobranchus ocellatus TaxID=259542 RepID=A0AAV4AA92_9GAST|nr:phosphofurin acidic cluster sorting protein 2 [Plakobranchus ocellatus]